MPWNREIAPVVLLPTTRLQLKTTGRRSGYCARTIRSAAALDSSYVLRYVQPCVAVNADDTYSNRDRAATRRASSAALRVASTLVRQASSRLSVQLTFAA